MLEGIKQFFLSRFWKERYLRRINEEGMLDRYSQFPEINVRIKFIFENKNLDGRAYNSTIEINLNKHPWKDDIEYLENTLIHEYGHLLYMQTEFQQVILLNDLILKSPSPTLLKTDSYYKYDDIFRFYKSVA